MPSVTQYANKYLQGAINLLDDTSFLFPFGGALSLNGLWNEVSGKASQQREFEQQEYLQDKENQYNDPSAQMERMIAAGINPNIAASGIAGSPNLSAQPPTVATSDPAGGLNALGSVAGSAAGAVMDVAGAGASIIGSILNVKKLPIEVGEMIANTTKLFADAGVSDQQAKSLSIMNAFLPTEKALGLVSLRQSIENSREQFNFMRTQQDLLRKQMDEIDQMILESGSRISLNESQSLLNRKNSLFVDSQTLEQNFWNNFRSANGLDPRYGVDNNLLMLGFTNPAAYNKCLEIVLDSQYNKLLGGYNADSATIFERTAKQNAGQKVGEFNGLGKTSKKALRHLQHSIQNVNNQFDVAFGTSFY